MGRKTCKKVRFPTKGKAWEALDQIALKKVAPGTKRPVRAYKCTRCGGWHITSKALRR